jgi:putative ABC transport system permease protein
VTSFRPGYWDHEGEQQTLVALDSRGGSQTLDIGLTGADWPALRDGVFVFEGTAERHGWQIGDTVPMGFAKTGLFQMPITGIYKERNIVQSDYLLDLSVFAQHFVGFTTDADTTVLVALDPSLSSQAGRDIVEIAAADFANVAVQDHDEYLASRLTQIDMGTAAFTLLIVFAVFIATIGVANTLALSVHERTKEIGLLRSVGLTRGQVRRLVTWESLVVALMGSLLGVGIGALFGVAIASTMAAQGVAALSIPIVLLVVVTLCGAIAGLAAAIIPAGIAARTPVLEAITYE